VQIRDIAPMNIPPNDEMYSTSLVTKPKKGSTYFSVLVGSVTGSAASILLAWATATGIGFTTSGIAAGSIAAGMMSATAIANGGGVPALSLVAGLQSFGAVGLGTTTIAGFTIVSSVAVAGALVGAGIAALIKWWWK
jgi:hypothetical protein